jgi:hypothetical protein
MQIYIDNEIPWSGGLGEWDAGVLASGAAGIVRSASAAFPDRGASGLRITSAAGNPVYIRKNNAIPALPPGGSVWVGLWLRVNQAGPNYTYFLSLCGYAVRLGLEPTLFGVVINDSGGPHFTNDAPAATGSWRYVVLKVTRATAPGAADGRLEMWVDGRALTPVAGYANFNKLAGGGELDLGNFTPPANGFVIDADEVKVSTDGYPAPFVPTPADELPSPARTVVLYRRASADSRLFADYCAARLGIPQANLVALDYGRHRRNAGRLRQLSKPVRVAHRLLLRPAPGRGRQLHLLSDRLRAAGRLYGRRRAALGRLAIVEFRHGLHARRRGQSAVQARRARPADQDAAGRQVSGLPD